MGGGDLLEVLLVAWRGVGGVQCWCVLESELGAPFYRRSEVVAVNGDLRRWLRWCSAWSGVLGSWASTWSSTGSVLTLNKLGLGVLGGFDGTGRRGPVGGRGRALCLPGHDGGAAGVHWHA